jgi:acyl-CoA hydrolase
MNNLNNPTLTDALPQHELQMSVLMTPDMANFSGNVHGGDLLKLLDQVAYACASRYSGHYAVTLSVDQVIFKEPIHVGELVTFLASINHVGRTSMEVGIRVEAQNIRQRSVRHTNSCYFTMVAIDNGKPAAAATQHRHAALPLCRRRAAQSPTPASGAHAPLRVGRQKPKLTPEKRSVRRVCGASHARGLNGFCVYGLLHTTFHSIIYSAGKAFRRHPAAQAV